MVTGHYQLLRMLDGNPALRLDALGALIDHQDVEEARRKDVVNEAKECLVGGAGECTADNGR